MRVRTALLCDSATVREGLLHVLGAGITRLWRAELPAPMAVALAVVIECDADEAKIPHEVGVLISGPDGARVAELRGAIEIAVGRLESGELQLVPLAMPLMNVGVGVYGRHVIEVSLDAKAPDVIEFWVLHPEEKTLPPL